MRGGAKRARERRLRETVRLKEESRESEWKRERGQERWDSRSDGAGWGERSWWEEATSNNCEWGFGFLIDCFVCERERCRVAAEK